MDDMLNKTILVVTQDGRIIVVGPRHHRIPENRSSAFPTHPYFTT